jgi:CubicO group peptidase (beta-lactamase class C family)
VPLEQAMALPPTETLNSWLYSNGNYCALGLLVQHVTGLDLAQAAYALVFDPAGVTGPFLSTDGSRGSSVPYPKGLARLARLGGAGTWLASTDDIAAMLSAVTDGDRTTLEWPGIIVDQYGWGHTGSVDGAEACAWVLQDGYTVITAFVSGSKPNTGGKVCDRVVPALAIDLGAYAGDPIRTPD